MLRKSACVEISKRLGTRLRKIFPSKGIGAEKEVFGFYRPRGGDSCGIFDTTAGSFHELIHDVPQCCNVSISGLIFNYLAAFLHTDLDPPIIVQKYGSTVEIAVT